MRFKKELADEKKLSEQELDKYVLETKTHLLFTEKTKEYIEDFTKLLVNKNINYYSRKDTNNTWKVHEEDLLAGEIIETKYGRFFKKISGIEIKLFDDIIFIPINEDLNWWKTAQKFYTISNSSEYAKSDNNLFFKISIPADNEAGKINTYHYLELKKFTTLI